MNISGFNQAAGVNVSNSLSDLLNTKKVDKNDPAAQAEAKAEAKKAAQKNLLNEIKEKGIYAWAQEVKMDKLKEKIREQVLDSKGMDEQSLANAPDDVAKSIQEEIARLINDAMQKNLEGRAQQAAQDGQPTGPMIIDISV
jgi:predicted component of type VI protein secretion system